MQALLSFPTVVIGLLLYLLLSRRGPLGAYELLFTPWAIMIGYMVMALPVLVVFTVSAVQGADPRVYETARCLGAGRARASFTTLWEVRFGVLAAVVNSFGRVVSEVGCAIMVGGNIAGLTRNIPTAIALETTKGEFAQGIALGMVLMAVALGVNVVFALLQGEGGLK
jgi:tungstate transport system permease protein